MATVSDMSSIAIRPASDDDVAGIVELVRDRIGEEDAPEAHLVLSDPSFDRSRWTVAVDAGKVVSTSAAFPMNFHYGSAKLTATNIEFVATAETHEGQGLVRRQLDVHHGMAAEHGEAIQIIVGIPYFYRLFGYEYALPVAPLRVLPADVTVPAAPGWETRAATSDDADIVLGLQDQARRHATVAFGHTRLTWRFILDSPVYQTVIAASRDGDLAMGRIYLDDGMPVLTDVVANDSDGLAAIVAEARTVAPDAPTFLLSRPGLTPHLAAWDTDDYSYGYYIRIADPVAFLNAVRPVLEKRLRTSPFEARIGNGVISLYGSSIRFGYENGSLSLFEAGGPVPAPGAQGGAGIPPDRFCSLVLGDVGVRELARRHPDVRPGVQAELLTVMFPKVPSDVASWVVP